MHDSSRQAGRSNVHTTLVRLLQTMWTCTGAVAMKHTLGGSVVILMPRCRMAMGKWGEGLLDSQRRKSGWGFLASKPSTSLSRAGSQVVMRWQLARNTQWPPTMPSWINLLAMPACHRQMLISHEKINETLPMAFQ